MTTLEVVAALVIQGSEVLICRRAAHKDAPGKWEFPGGKAEPAETQKHALAREIAEELGVQIKVLDLYDRSSTEVGAGGVESRIIELSCYFCELIGPRPTASTDHDLLLWVPLGDLVDFDWAAPDLPVVKRLSALAQLGAGPATGNGD